jgi:hypothetical protein
MLNPLYELLSLANLGFQGLGYDFFSNMKLFDSNDRNAIEWGLKRVFDYEKSKINQAITSQVLFNLVCCVLNMHLLAETYLCSGSISQPQPSGCSGSISQPQHSGGSGQHQSTTT